MSQAAKDLGISTSDLYYAMKLIREIRARFVASNGDPRALRVALIYANLVDRDEASKRLTTHEMNALSDIAVEYFNKSKGRLGY